MKVNNTLDIKESDKLFFNIFRVLANLFEPFMRLKTRD
jgi:hypothetical protein